MVLYPDNKNRGNRVQQLATTIGIIQADIDETVKRIEDDTKYQVKDIDVLLKLLKFNTYDELFTALKKLLTPEQLKAYEAQVAEMQNLDELTTDIMQVSSAVALVSGITAVLSKPVVLILNAGNKAASITLLTRGFLLLLKGDTKGLKLMVASMRAFRRIALDSTELGSSASRIVRYFRAASTVLTVVGIVLDGILLIYEAIVGDKQRTELQKAIKELVARRFQARDLQSQIQATESQSHALGAVLGDYIILVENNASEDLISKLMEDKFAKITEQLQNKLNALTRESVWKQCQLIDQVSGNAWTNEDPTLDQTVAWIESQPAMEGQLLRVADDISTFVTSVTLSPDTLEHLTYELAHKRHHQSLVVNLSVQLRLQSIELVSIPDSKLHHHHHLDENNLNHQLHHHHHLDGKNLNHQLHQKNVDNQYDSEGA